MKTIIVTRAQMEACSRALPKKVYRSSECGCTYAHDEGYQHWAQRCPMRKHPIGADE